MIVRKICASWDFAMQIVPWKLKQGVYFYWRTPASLHFGKNFPKETCLCFHSFLRNFLKNCHFKVGKTRKTNIIHLSWLSEFIILYSWKLAENGLSQYASHTLMFSFVSFIFYSRENNSKWKYYSLAESC